MKRSDQDNNKIISAVFAIAAAILYGASFPLSKQILDQEVNPFILAGLFYTVQAILFFSIRTVKPADHANRLQKSDWLWLSGTIIAGGIAAPVLYLLGQKQISAHLASLISPLEIFFTTIIAIMLFKEPHSRSEIISIILITLGASVIGMNIKTGDKSNDTMLGAILVLSAFFAWGIDNNCTAQISKRDTLQIAGFKGLFGGAANLCLGILLGASIPSSNTILIRIGLIGIFCFGISFVLIIFSMRSLGASKTIALFGSNPAVGVALSWLLLGESPSFWYLIGGAVMIIGIYALIFKPVKAVQNT
ncbi:MAG: DMT family transporter [Planctomycetes bacterium]|nr:DMT family transporter [Planctomycetota bacterium]